ncbi:MAG: hypothetical protein OSB19_09005 [Opitutaceae bacterium]|nr:hypothetical protein [Opitutaceae bacterium]
MRRLDSLTKAALSGFLIILLGSFPLFSQSALSESGVGDGDDFLIELEAYVKYGGSIDVIDGMTGKKYHGGDQVVKAIYNNFPKIMGGLHRKLLELEARHMAFQMRQGTRHGDMLSELAKSFGIRGFYMDDENWLKKERTILSRLTAKPFFKIKELVVWELEGLSGMAIRNNERGKNLKFNTETMDWERRVLTEWEVNIRGRKSFKRVNKWQGLNLDTNKGFHISDSLPGSVYTSSFEEIQLSYPIIVSRSENEATQIDRLQHLIVQNISHLYDPFSWGAPRKTRFRTAFASRLRRHMEDRSSRMTDRDWFDRVMSSFLNDVVTLKTYGLEEVYDLYVVQRFEYRQLMGVAMDPLNWHDGEDRSPPKQRNNKKISFNFKSHDGARFALLDVYLRYGDVFLENLRLKLTGVKKKTESRSLIRAAIEEVSGVPADTYIQAALKAQKAGIIDYRDNRNN